ncbi:MAG: phage integrase family protein [Bacilli bacterium]|nr:phage integrase family protein [Bacilli bacterium]
MANIQKRSENAWFFTVSLGKGANGKYIRKTKTITIEDNALLKTKKKLQDYLDDEYANFRQEVLSGEYIALDKMTFLAFVEEWEKKYAIKHLKPGTLEIYLIHLKNRAIPSFGHSRLGDIKTMHIINLMDELTRAEKMGATKGTLAAGTIHYVLRAVRSVFTRAVEWKLIKSNPADGVKKPKIDRTEINVYADEEIKLLLTALENAAPHWRMMITLALTTGLRKGELLGLEWKHIDLVKGTLSVEQSLSSSKKNRYLISEPKTKSSRRSLSLSAPIISKLKEYKIYCNKERLLISNLWEEGKRFFIFTAISGKPLSPYSLDSYWKKFLIKHELRHIRFHDLRHTAATWMLNKGVNIKNVSDILGHANITTTLNLYAHTQKADKQAAADTFDSLFPQIKTN